MTSLWKRHLTGITLMLGLLVGPGLAQDAPLFFVNNNTRVGKVRFDGNRTFEDGDLSLIVATKAPGLIDKLTFWSQGNYPFSPVELVKDTRRLQRFYNRNGFLQVEVDFEETTLDTTKNQVSVVFDIREGPPLLVRNLEFLGPDGRNAIFQFDEGKEQLRWQQFEADIEDLKSGERFTEFKLARVKDQALQRLTDRGYAFAEVRAATDIDTTANLIDIQFHVEAGPQGYLDAIDVEGNQSVSAEVVRRELPFQVGDRYEHRKLINGQRQLFGLDLFRVALIGLTPQQPADTSVTIRVNVEEAALRYASAQTGYSTEEGITLGAGWKHRNLLGGARSLEVRGKWSTGFLWYSSESTIRPQRLDLRVPFKQPYLGTTRLQGIFTPFYQRSIDRVSEGQKFGFTSTFIYEVVSFRPITFQYLFSRASFIGRTADALDELLENRFFSESVFSLEGVMGKVDNYIRPRDGFLFRPAASFGGAFLETSLKYAKLQGELTYYKPLGGELELATRLFAGHLWPRGNSRDSLDTGNARIERQFDLVQFYAGGASDVRGWGRSLLGPKDPVVLSETENDDGTIDRTYVYQPRGSEAKISGNVELRFPAPGLGSAWQMGAFVDFGYLGERGFDFGERKLLIGSGVGIRYLTPAGFLRLDLAYKIRSEAEDLRTPGEYAEQGVENTNPSFLRGLKLHFSIGQAF